MATRTLYLITYRRVLRERTHFAIWAPYKEEGGTGTLIQVLGAPMAGYGLEFKRAYSPAAADEPKEMIPLAKIDAQLLGHWTGTPSTDSTPRGNLESIAAQIPPPGISRNFLAPVNDTTNRRCQEWTMDFLRRLVAVGYLDNSVIDTVQAQRDPPDHGIFSLQGGLKKAAQPAHDGIPWVWDDEHRRYRYWNGSEWVWIS
ncbi:hypothetical protein K491DRAFT_139372 [Lophiostoma macrostomum CBS 122681]|uniref:Uncharacterized protein n=1 Tax=Lophiostoma macrostomum CBS 122681 TaxID=1314788 RepID=A0A6A6SS60_9PLEO|nr:hypothetical protein K491DRAFT_139372 [Lophiostoma macrostomum CBS 122681]